MLQIFRLIGIVVSIIYVLAISNNFLTQWGHSITNNTIWAKVILPTAYITTNYACACSAVGSGVDSPAGINVNYTQTYFEIGGTRKTDTLVGWITCGY